MKDIVLWGAVLLSSMCDVKNCEAKNKDTDLSFETFKKQYNLSDTTTEQHSPITETLSQTFQENKIEGLKLLHAVDKQVVKGLEDFNKAYLKSLSQTITRALQKGGRVFLVGSGSSGRIGIDLAAKWKNYWKDDPKSTQVIGVMAGGVRAIVQAKEGFEDSEEEGRKALKTHKPTPKDVVILISASGSANYNIGFGKAGVEAKSAVYYFHNSTKVPARTQVLFDEMGVKKLLVDTGPQAISGSTRLQAATVAELCLGATFMKVIYGEKKISPDYDYVNELKSTNRLIEKEFTDIARIIEAGVKAFSSGGANFRKLKDEDGAAYITILGDQNSIREVLVDATETAPTFSTNPPRSIHETHKKKSEFRAYLMNETDNEQAWKSLSGYALFSNLDKQEVGEMCVAEGASGFGSFGDRPKGEGNLVMVALKSKPTPETLTKLKEIRQAGGKLALIYMSPKSEKISKEDAKLFHIIVHLPLDKKDPFGVIQTVALKQTLNMISNGIMLGMHKVIGNRMIDLRLANQKLIYRSIRIIKDLMKDSKITLADYSDEDLYKMLLKANAYKTVKESKEGIYIPTPVKVVLTQISKSIDLKQAVQVLYENGESI